MSIIIIYEDTLFLNVDLNSERVLKYYYDSNGVIGINDARDYFHFTHDQIHDIVKDLENRNFISASPGYPEGTVSPYAPKGFGPGKLYQITKKGVDYIEKQGEFKENVSNTYSQTITNSPNAQMMTGSSNSQQNIIDNKTSNGDLSKLEDLYDKIEEFKKELSQIQQNINQSILQNDKTVIEKFLTPKSLNFLSSKLNGNLSLDKVFDYFGLSSRG